MNFGDAVLYFVFFVMGLFCIFLLLGSFGVFGDRLFCDLNNPDFNTSEYNVCFSGEFWECTYCERFDDCSIPPYKNPVCIGGVEG